MPQPQLPDLSFLKPHQIRVSTFNPPTFTSHQYTTITLPTPQSVISPLSVNRQGTHQLQALREAEKWFSGAVTVLEERLKLAMEMKEDLGQVVRACEDLMVRQTQVDLGNQTGEKEAEEHGRVEREEQPNGGDGGGDDEARKSNAQKRAEVYLDSIRVLRAKWNAGGRLFERWSGTR